MALPPIVPPAQDPQGVQQNQQAGGTDPFSQILQRMITQGTQGPPPERPLNNWEIFAGLTHPQLLGAVLGRTKDTPQWQQYEASQKMLPAALGAYGQEQGRLATQNRFQETQDRLKQQADFRQRVLSQYKADTKQEYDPTTGTNRFHTYYRNPLQNNQVVYDEWTDYAPIHYGMAYNDKDEAIRYPQSPLPPAQAPGSPPAPQRSAPVSGNPPVSPGGMPPSGTPPQPGNLAPAGTAGKGARGVTKLGFVKPPSPEQEQYARTSALIKDRMAKARTLIESTLSPETPAGQPSASYDPRWTRALEAMGTHDPTGMISGSDAVANARTYRALITELGSLTRGLYGAAGVRSYQEIQNLIDTMPSWASGSVAIKQQFNNLDAAIKVADQEMAKIRPDLVQQSTDNRPSLDEIKQAVAGVR